MNASHSGKYILVVEDDQDLGQMLIEILEEAGYRALRVFTGAGAKAEVDREPPDLILLDLVLPDTDGLILCADLQTRATAPIVVVSGSTERRDTILAFKLGADDFIAKPFDIDNLLARVEALLRVARIRPAGAVPQSSAPPPTVSAARSPSTQEPRLRHAGLLSIDAASRKVSVDGESVFVTPTQFRILAALVDRLGEVVTRDEIALRAWGIPESGVGRALDVQIRRLRVRLAGAGAASPAITSVRGFGYKLDARSAGDLSAAA